MFKQVVFDLFVLKGVCVILNGIGIIFFWQNFQGQRFSGGLCFFNLGVLEI